MLHHLVPDEVEDGSLLPNLDYYDRGRARQLALAGDPCASSRGCAVRRGPRGAVHRSRIDLDDLTGTTAGGVHSRRWAALGRRSRSASRASAREATG